MKFRSARHTDNLDAITQFYTQVIGLEKLGSFNNHSNYDGVFLGFPQLDWHLEFTTSNEKANHHPDKDDVLVFYVKSKEAQKAIQKDAERFGFTLQTSKNPYWQTNGIEITDPDGFGVIIAVREEELQAQDTITQLLRERDITSWGQFLEYVRAIPYGRNVSRTAFELVIKEHRGTCSSKHALVKTVADANHIGGVELVMGIYKMTQENTQGIGTVLENNKLSYLPEAHCYLKVNGKRIDLTNAQSDILRLEKDILLEQSINPTQVGIYKVDFHKKYIKDWIASQNINRSFDDIWAIREQCIAALSN